MHTFVPIFQRSQSMRTSSIMGVSRRLDRDSMRRESEVRVEWALTYGSSESQSEYCCTNMNGVNDSLERFIVSKYRVCLPVTFGPAAQGMA